MKLMVAVPTVDYVPADFVKSLSKLSLRLGRERIPADVEIVGGTLVYIARNRLAYRAITDGYTHVLWLDSDMVFGDSIVEVTSSDGFIDEKEEIVVKRIAAGVIYVAKA